MNKKHRLRPIGLALCAIVLIDCSSNAHDIPEPVPEQDEVVDVTDDVHAPDYWNKAELLWSDEFEGSVLSPHSLVNNHTNGMQITSGPVPLESIEEEFNTYGVLWKDKYLKFYFDDVENIVLSFLRPSVVTFENWPFSQPFYLLMNIAVGGNWGGLQGVDDTVFPATMEVDYVRVFQVK